ncbi:hypothetical protein TNCV_279711 [Trichonephila clavipes]|nr:hypothetical protein TNCV_279711 [Trichonephila clavipes]
MRGRADEIVVGEENAREGTFLAGDVVLQELRGCNLFLLDGIKSGLKVKGRKRIMYFQCSYIPSSHSVPYIFLRKLLRIINPVNSGWVEQWLGTGLVRPVLPVRPRLKLVDFYDAENRHVIFIECQFGLGALGKIKTLNTTSRRQSSSGSLWEGNLTSKLHCGNWYLPIWCHTKK